MILNVVTSFSLNRPIVPANAGSSTSILSSERRRGHAATDDGRQRKARQPRGGRDKGFTGKQKKSPAAGRHISSDETACRSAPEWSGIVA